MFDEGEGLLNEDDQKQKLHLAYYNRLAAAAPHQTSKLQNDTNHLITPYVASSLSPACHFCLSASSSTSKQTNMLKSGHCMSKAVQDFRLDISREIRSRKFKR